MNTQPLPDDWLEIGTIVAPQGLKGELRVLPDSDFPERFEKPGQRWLRASNRQEIQAVELLRGRHIPGKNLYVIQLQGVDDREQAELLRGYKLLVAKCDRPQLEEDEYHVSDLINLDVYNQKTGEKVGFISDILSAGNDLLEVTLYQQPALKETPQPDLSKINRLSKLRQKRAKPQKVATILIPFVRELVPTVNLQERRLEIAPIPGLLELNNPISENETESESGEGNGEFMGK
jgi:16S rRNA processing protein RimM